MAHDTTDRRQESTAVGRLMFAIELSAKRWKLAFDDGRRDRPRLVTIDAWDFHALEQHVARAKKAMGLSQATAVASCYEAGRDGFAVHRRLAQLGIDNIVVDPSSIEVSRRARRVKTDRLDAEWLVRKLAAHSRGEHVFSVVRVPPPDAEAARHPEGELQDLKTERTRHRLRIESWLCTEGIVMRWKPSELDALDALRTIDGRALSPELVARIRHENARLVLVQQQIDELEAARSAMLTDGKDERAQRIRTLMTLRAVGPVTASRLVLECFGWRRFANRREVGSCFGLSPSPFASGQLSREQGISKIGNRRLRAALIELSWLWVRYQPDSVISRWFRERFAAGGVRQRKIGIVAAARRLVIALWKYVEFGLVPQGAAMKS